MRKKSTTSPFFFCFFVCVLYSAYPLYSPSAARFRAKLKELEGVVNPIVSEVYQASGGAPGGGGGGDEEFSGDEL